MLILELSAYVLEISNNYYNMLLSHWLFITRSRLMQADWLNQDNNAFANLHTYLPYCSMIVIYLGFFFYILYLHRNRRTDRVDYESSFPSATQPASRSSSNNSSRNKFSHIETVSVKAEENICELPAFIPNTKKT